MGLMWRWAERGMAVVGLAGLVGAAGYYSLHSTEPAAVEFEAHEVFLPSPHGDLVAQHISRIGMGETGASCVDEIYVYPARTVHRDTGQGQGRQVYGAACRRASAGFEALKIRWHGKQALGFKYSINGVSNSPASGEPLAAIAVETRISW